MKQYSGAASFLQFAAIASLLAVVPCVAYGQIDVVWQGPDAGDYWADNNWPPPSGGGAGLEPLADFGEQAVVDNGTTAVVSRAANPGVDPSEGNPGGVKLGPAAATSGGLRIVSGGALVVEAGSFDDGVEIFQTDGFVDVGQSGQGTLTVLGGGTLGSVGIRSGGDASSSITFGDTSGQSATISTGFAGLTRNTRVVGPNVNFTSTNGIQLSSAHTLIAEITHPSNHSALRTSALAQIGGTLRPVFNGITPQVNNEWTLIDAGYVFGDFESIDTSGLPALGPGQGYRVTREAGGNGELVKLAVNQLLTLVVDYQSGAATITNEGATPVAIDGYSILSPSGSLGGSWNSLADQGQSGWQEATPTASALSELSQSGTRTITNGSPATLGAPYQVVFPEFGVDPDDVAFEFTLDGDVVEGLVKYTGTKVQNNLAIVVDPSTGQVQFKNDSPHDVVLEGYSIFSPSGSLNTDNSNWESLTDKGVIGWREAGLLPTVASELNPDGSLLLEGQDSYDFGTLFDSSGSQDLAFEYQLVGESSTRTGAVVYAAIPEGVPGDYNSDGVVNLADYTVWRDNLGGAIALPNEGAGISPGQVTTADYTFWKSQFGANSGAGAVDSIATSRVPEPTSLVLLTSIVAIGLARCQWRPRLTFGTAATKGLAMSIIAIVGIGLFATAPMARAVVVLDEDFEGESGLPTGWTLVDNNAGTADPAFTLVTGHDGTGGNSGQAGHIGDMIDGIPGPGQPAGGWLQSPAAVNASMGWQLQFDIKFGAPSEGTVDDSIVVFGDLDGRNYYTLVVTEGNPNNDLLYLQNDDRQGNGDAGTPVVGTNDFASGLVDNTWYTGSLTYNPNSDGLSFQLSYPLTDSIVGSFNTKLNGTHRALNSATAMFETINPALSGSVQFGFGTLNDNGTFDNILLETISTVAGDVDGNGVANINDFAIIRDNFRQRATLRSQGDLTGDGFVDLSDYRVWRDTQPASVVAIAANSIPEPGAVVLLSTLVGLLGIRRIPRCLARLDS